MGLALQYGLGAGFGSKVQTPQYLCVERHDDGRQRHENGAD